MKKEMLINVLQSEECRIAILENGTLEELYVERSSHESYVGNIYKGKIVNIEPSIQAAFVDFGVGRNGFLHISDVEPTYWRHLEGGRGDGGRGDGGRGREDRRDRGDRDRGDRDRGRGRDREQPAPLPGFSEGVDLDREIDRLEQEASAEEAPVSRAAPAAPAAPVAPARVPDDFTAGVDLSPPEEPGPAGPRGKADPLVAAPGTEGDEDSGKPRRRSRGGSRKKARPAGGEAPEASGPEKGGPDEPPAPRLMDSAERRTERTNGPESGHDRPGEGSGLDFDPDLFFPSAPAPAAPPPPPAPAEPVRAEPVAPPPAARAPEPREAPVERARPVRRSRRMGPEDIEAALEADLAEAEMKGEEADAFAPPPPARERAEVEEVEEEGPDDEMFDTGAPAGALDDEAVEAEGGPEDDFDEDFDFGGRSRPRGRDRDRGRGGRDRDRDRGRGPRRGGRDSGRPGAGRPRPLIQDVFKRGQEVIVQVIKEGIGTKGPTLSTYISIPGRYLVLMPCLNRTGVSRKIEDDEQRRRLRQMFNELKPPQGLGFIMRTAAIDKNKKEVQRDLVYLCRLWQVIVRRIKKTKSPTNIYEESEMVTRTIRDNFTSEIDTIWVDQKEAFEAAQEFMQVVMPRYADRIKLFEGREPLFHKFGIEDEIHRIQQKKVPLPNGGSIVIEQTEALVAIDVNSGNFRAEGNNAEETAYQMNLHAAKEIARQLRLRDLGGVIVNDFIDMRDEKHRRGVEKALRDAMRRDRARAKILKISQFGIIEMTRQRVRPSLKRSGYTECPACKGHGLVKSAESMAIELMRLVQLASCKESVVRVEVTVSPEVADYLLNRKRREIVQMEEANGMTVQVRGVAGTSPEHIHFVGLDRNDNEVRLTGPEPLPYRARR